MEEAGNEANVEARSVQCVICSSHDNTVHLWCSHVICAPCGNSAHSFGHRRCPMCRVPHLLDMEQLRTNAKQLRKGYNEWRRGNPNGAKRQTSDVSGYTGWRLDIAADCDGEARVEDEMYSVDAGVLFIFDPRRALPARQALTELELEKKIAELNAELKQVQLEKKIAELKSELEQVQLEKRAQQPKRFRWADDEPEKCLAEAMGTPATRYTSRVPELRIRPMSRRHVLGTEHPLPKLTPRQVAYRKSLIGQRVRVLEGPDTGLTGTLSHVSPWGYATIILEGAGPNIVLPPRVAADPAVRHVLEPRCVYSCAIGPVPTPVFQRSKLRRGFRRTVGFNHVSFLECQSNSLDLYEFADEDDDC